MAGCSGDFTGLYLGFRGLLRKAVYGGYTGFRAQGFRI